MDSAPEKITPNELLKLHGPSGWLIRRLQRYALLGWGLFFVLLAFHMLVILVSAMSPKPVVAVDAGGRVLGTMEYLHPSSRSDEELVAGAMHFAGNYLSLNSATIFEDYAAALNMMGEELRGRTIEQIRQDGYLARVQRAKTRSRVEFAAGENRPLVIARNGLDAEVRLRGNIVIMGEGGAMPQPFDITLALTAVPRSTLATHGLRINSLRDN